MARRSSGGVESPPPATALGAALRGPVLWWLAAALFLGSWPCYAATKHVILYLRDLGVPPLPAAGMLSWMLLAAGGGRLFFGVLWDYTQARTILILDYTMLAAGALLLLGARSPALRTLYIVVFGLGYGGLMPLVPLTVVAYFGRRTMGAVLGFFKLFYDAAAALAPLVTAYLYDVRGDYGLAFSTNAVLPCVALAILLLGLGPPDEQPATRG